MTNSYSVADVHKGPYCTLCEYAISTLDQMVQVRLSDCVCVRVRERVSEIIRYREMTYIHEDR